MSVEFQILSAIKLFLIASLRQKPLLCNLHSKFKGYFGIFGLP